MSTPSKPLFQTTGLAINPVLKRVLKGLGAYLLAHAALYLMGQITSNPTLFGGSVLTSIVAAVLLGIEKAFPSNL